MRNNELNFLRLGFRTPGYKFENLAPQIAYKTVTSMRGSIKLDRHFTDNHRSTVFDNALSAMDIQFDKMIAEKVKK